MRTTRLITTFQPIALSWATLVLLSTADGLAVEVPKQKEVGVHSTKKKENQNPAEVPLSISNDAETEIQSLRGSLRKLKTALGFTIAGLLVLLVLYAWPQPSEKRVRTKLATAQLESKKQEQMTICLEQQIIGEQKQKDVAKLVGAIVHEFNNSLTSIVAQSEIGTCLNDVDAKDDAFQQITKMTLQAAELASELLSFSVRDSMSFGRIDLNEVVSSAFELLANITRGRSNLDLQLADVDVSVYANRVQLQQVVFNLIHNSIESQSEFRDVVISTGRRPLDRVQLEQACFSERCEPGEFCFIKIADNGVGMDKESMRQMFDPSFTSKFIGRGLGLTSVLAIVRSCRGAVDVKSLPDTGTSVTLFLPILSIANRESFDAIQTTSDLKDEVSVLFVDDDPILRESAKLTLASSRIDALVASNADEALKIARVRDKPFDCVVINYLMSANNGIYLAAKFRENAPDTTLVLSSGFAENTVFDSQLFDGFLAKPYFPHQLVETIWQAIGVSPDD